MKTSFVKIISAITLLLVVISCSDDNSLAEDTIGMDSMNDLSIADEILVLINEHRASIGLGDLTKNTTAEELAADHSRYMIVQKAISHDNFSARADVLGDKENATGMAENVASSYPTAESVVNAWLNSPDHKNNIEGNYTYTGIAAIKDQQGRYYYTQLFYR